MYSVIIWGSGMIYNQHLNLIKYFEKIGQISVCGVFADDVNIHGTLDGYRICSKKDINLLKYDYCIVAFSDFEGANHEAKQLGISADKLIPVRVLEIPYFDFEKYIRIKNSRLSIISRNCWAGICYHYFAFEFLSPTINMFFEDSDFNKFLSNMDYYLARPVRFLEMRYSERMKRYYPVGQIEDIILNFNHYTQFDEAINCWERRKKRINRKNLLIVSSSESKENAIEFDKLPYENKIIFVPQVNNLNLKSSVPIAYDNKPSNITLGMYINRTANGKLSMIDLFSLLQHDPFLRTHMN